MSKEIWTAVERYHENLIIKPDPRFQEIIDRTLEAGLPPLHVPPCLGAFLELLVRALDAKLVLEIGTLGGYSTAWLARGLPPDGKLISLEIDPDLAELAQNNLSGFSFFNKIEIMVGDAMDSVGKLIQDGKKPADLIFIDGDKSQYPDYLEISINISRPGTLIIADNVVREGKILEEDSSDPRVRGVRAFNQMVSDHPRLQATVLQTVGKKWHDGFTVLVVDPT